MTHSPSLPHTIQLTAADGHQLDAWLHPASSARKGGVVILQEIFGVTDQLKGVAQMYADWGYDAMVPALFDRRARGTVVPFDDAPTARDLMMACDLDETTSDIAAAVDYFQTRGAVAVLGFCWGGGLAVRAAERFDLAASVAFYGTRLNQYLDHPVIAPLLAHFGATDDHVPPEMREEFITHVPDATVYLYDAGHGFANDARPAYVAKEATLAHRRTREFLDQRLV